MNRNELNVYEFGLFRLDANDHILLRSNHEVHLTEKVFSLLLLLVQRSGHLVTKEELMEQVWPDSIVEENNLTVSMSLLRKALGEKQEGCRYIETVPKRGYRFVAAVREMKEENDSRPGGDNKAYGRDLSGVSGSAMTTLAVLPLLNLSGDSNLEYLSDGMTESLIDSVSQSSQIKVLARNTVFRYKGSKLSVHEMGKALNAEAALTGSVTQMENRLIVKVELVDVQNSSQLWGEQFKRQVSDILALQATIVKRITETLWLKLTGRERKSSVKQHTRNFDAYLLYLKGIYFLNRRTKEDVKRAIQYLEQAISIDPDYAMAYRALASCYNLLSVMIYPCPIRSYQKSK
jgi:TolB-like protein/DNA-binding winged helix-turn-helix (wHTH) protein